MCYSYLKLAVDIKKDLRTRHYRQVKGVKTNMLKYFYKYKTR